MRPFTLAVLLALGAAAPAFAQTTKGATAVGDKPGQQGAGSASTSGSVGGGSGGTGGMHTDPVSPGGVGSGISTNTQPSGAGGTAKAGGSTSGTAAH